MCRFSESIRYRNSQIYKKSNSKFKSKASVFVTGTGVFLKEYFLAEEPDGDLNGYRLENNVFLKLGK